MQTITPPPVVVATYHSSRTTIGDSPLFMGYWSSKSKIPANVSVTLTSMTDELADPTDTSPSAALRRAFLAKEPGVFKGTFEDRDYAVRLTWSPMSVTYDGMECWFAKVQVIEGAPIVASAVGDMVRRALNGIRIRVEYTPSVDMGWRFKDGVWRADGEGEPTGYSECVINIE